jgi:NAD(P)-dependent dehydrogenase (short-subunit alcohol dehydrogenase family)
VQQIYYRFFHGQTQDKRFAQFIHMNALLEQMSLNVIHKSSPLTRQGTPMSKTHLFDLDGKIAFVSGASRGIGEAIAKLLAQQGAHVIVSSRKIDGCQHVADAIIAAGGKATAIACHIGEMEQISEVFAGIRQQFGRLDILVNNAATNPQFCNVLDTDLGAFQKTVDVNIRGYFFMSVEAGKLMRDNGGGSIINVASINGISPGALPGHLLGDQGRSDQHDQGVCQGMCAVRHPLQRPAAGPDRHQVCLGPGEKRRRS